MRLNKREVIDAIQSEYVDGDKSLRELAERFGVNRQNIYYYGRIGFPNWAEITERKRAYCTVKTLIPFLRDREIEMLGLLRKV